MSQITEQIESLEKLVLLYGNTYIPTQNELYSRLTMMEPTADFLNLTYKKDTMTNNNVNNDSTKCINTGAAKTANNNQQSKPTPTGFSPDKKKARPDTFMENLMDPYNTEKRSNLLLSFDESQLPTAMEHPFSLKMALGHPVRVPTPKMRWIWRR